MSWFEAVVVGLRDETPSARTLVLEVPGWPGHLPGQHVDVRLTAPDGYTAARSYSIASASDGTRLELTVDRLPDGEVSPYLTQDVEVGDPLDLMGPLGGWFVWRPDSLRPVQLLGGGSGVVPLMAMARTHARLPDPPAMRLLYSVREPAAVLYEHELADLRDRKDGVEVDLVYTRHGPAPGGAVGRVSAETLAGLAWPAAEEPDCFVCGPTGFVEHVADLLVRAGHAPARIRTERFGPTTGPRPSE